MPEFRKNLEIISHLQKGVTSLTLAEGTHGYQWHLSAHRSTCWPPGHKQQFTMLASPSHLLPELKLSPMKPSPQILTLLITLLFLYFSPPTRSFSLPSNRPPRTYHGGYVCLYAVQSEKGFLAGVWEPVSPSVLEHRGHSCLKQDACGSVRPHPASGDTVRASAFSF